MENENITNGVKNIKQFFQFLCNWYEFVYIISNMINFGKIGNLTWILFEARSFGVLDLVEITNFHMNWYSCIFFLFFLWAIRSIIGLINTIHFGKFSYLNTNVKYCFGFWGSLAEYIRNMCTKTKLSSLKSRMYII